MLDDIDRIEVIRGPGAAMWGANAVNGVINIVTKSDGRDAGRPRPRRGRAVRRARSRPLRRNARRGALPSVRAVDRPGSIAHRAGHARRRCVPQRHDGIPRRLGHAARRVHAGGRLHGGPGARAVAQPRPADGRSRTDRRPIRSDAQGGHLLGRWTHTRAQRRVAAGPVVRRHRGPAGAGRATTTDRPSTSTRNTTPRSARITIWSPAPATGSSARRFAGHVGFSLTPADDSSSLVTAFVQDEIALFGNRLAVTLGSQVQYDSDSGAGVQPTARVMWKARPRQRLWAAASRALRTPSLYRARDSRGLPAGAEPPAGCRCSSPSVGNPAAETETLRRRRKPDTGSRSGRPRRLTSPDSSGRYDHLRTQEAAAPVVQFVPSPQILVDHAVRQPARGDDARPRSRRPLDAGPGLAPRRQLHGLPCHAATLAAASLDPAAASEDGSAPRTQWQLRSAFSPGPRATLNVAVFHVGPLEQLQVDAYTRADVTAEWRFTSRLSAMAIGQNLFDAAHAEFAGAGSLLLATQVPRSASLRLRWTFR